MSFDWHQYLDLAQELAGQQQKPSTEDARLRSAASRAYYGAYCAARNKLEQDGDTTVRSQEGRPRLRVEAVRIQPTTGAEADCPLGLAPETGSYVR